MFGQQNADIADRLYLRDVVMITTTVSPTRRRCRLLTYTESDAARQRAATRLTFLYLKANEH